MRHLRRVGLITGMAVVVAASLPLGPAGAAGRRVGPDQYFTGVVNGTTGNTVTPIAVRMGCFGPLHPGETGHPLRGQTLAVHQLFPPSAAAGTVGWTGADSEIGVLFDAQPVTAAAATPPVFTRYDTPRKLPTTLTLPCSGTGTAYFTPFPWLPPSSSAAVPVVYESQP